MSQTFQSSAFIPRKQRDQARAERAVAHLKPGMAAALRRIEVTFDQAAVFNDRKLDVERILARGIESVETALRYVKYIGRCQADCFDLEQACSAVALARQLEEGRLAVVRAAHERGEFIIRYAGPIRIYRELHLLLRFMRAKGLRLEFIRAVYGADVPIVPASPRAKLVSA